MTDPPFAVRRPDSFVRLADDLATVLRKPIEPIVQRWPHDPNAPIGAARWTKNSVAFHVSREVALDYGLVEPTDAERAEREASLAQFRERQTAGTEQARAAIAALERIEHRTVRAVLALHAANANGQCEACLHGDDYEYWPCRTVEVIAAEHDVDLPSPYLIDWQAL